MSSPDRSSGIGLSELQIKTDLRLRTSLALHRHVARLREAGKTFPMWRVEPLQNGEVKVRIEGGEFPRWISIQPPTEDDINYHVEGRAFKDTIQQNGSTLRKDRTFSFESFKEIPDHHTFSQQLGQAFDAVSAWTQRSLNNSYVYREPIDANFSRRINKEINAILVNKNF